ncbi:HEPN domain-containing protein [Candidatus Sumerlaeota bacterium]|nr:HEPN domain-containing protein [Candidatus Sumerlaeota bacterium]
MSDKSEQLAQQWLKRAENDLVTARQTLLLPDGPTDTVCFHAQQAVEKALKGWLTFSAISFPKTHSLVRLLDMCLGCLPELEQTRAGLARLSGYAIDVRYPDAFAEPSRAQALDAMSLSEEVVALVSRRLSEALSGKGRQPQ